MGGRNSGSGRPGIKRSMMARQSSLGDDDGLDLEVEAEAEAEAAAAAAAAGAGGKGGGDSGIGDFVDATSEEESAGESSGSTLQGEEGSRAISIRIWTMVQSAVRTLVQCFVSTILRFCW